jgi:hypothetical protein
MPIRRSRWPPAADIISAVTSMYYRTKGVVNEGKQMSQRTEGKKARGQETEGQRKKVRRTLMEVVRMN